LICGVAALLGSFVAYKLVRRGRAAEGTTKRMYR
jgi:hypothetical protein